MKPDTRTLHLGHRERKHITCTAQALVVRNARGQTLRYPISRIARVVCSASASDWSGPALALCMSQGIGISWVDGQGNVIGGLYPCTQQIPVRDLHSQLEILLESADGHALYANWLRGRRMRVLQEWAREQEAPVSEPAWEELKHAWVYNGQCASPLPTALQGHCMAYVQAQLVQHGLPPILLDPQARPIDLAQDLCNLLRARLTLHTRSLAWQAHDELTQGALFESWIARQGGSVVADLSSLRRCALRATTP